jgi:hypothetical protein
MNPFFDPNEPMRPAGSADYVCARHFDEDFVVKWITDSAVAKECDVCARKSDRPIAAPTDDLVDLIRDGLETDWEDETQQMSYGMGVETVTTYDLLVELGVGPDDKAMQLLIDSLPDYAWVQRDFFQLTPTERVVSGWNEFKRLTQHHSRYFFSLQEKDGEDPDDVAPLQLLGVLGEGMTAAELLSVWGAGTKIYRARVHQADETVKRAWDLAALPEDKAKFAAANRMSAAGIPMFYGATTPVCAAEESRSVDQYADEKAVTVGEFEALRDLQILDLSREFEFPSLFDPYRREYRAALVFLQHFVRDLRKDVTRDEHEHIDYVPTQIVSEYFRSVYSFGDNVKLDGIAYSSTKTSGATNVVLFVSNLDVEDPDGSRPPVPESFAFIRNNFPYDPAILRLVQILSA